MSDFDTFERAPVAPVAVPSEGLQSQRIYCAGLSLIFKVPEQRFAHAQQFMSEEWAEETFRKIADYLVASDIVTLEVSNKTIGMIFRSVSYVPLYRRLCENLGFSPSGPLPFPRDSIQAPIWSTSWGLRIHICFAEAIRYYTLDVRAADNENDIAEEVMKFKELIDLATELTPPSERPPTGEQQQQPTEDKKLPTPYQQPSPSALSNLKQLLKCVFHVIAHRQELFVGDEEAKSHEWLVGFVREESQVLQPPVYPAEEPPTIIGRIRSRASSAESFSDGPQAKRSRVTGRNDRPQRTIYGTVLFHASRLFGGLRRIQKQINRWRRELTLLRSRAVNCLDLNLRGLQHSRTCPRVSRLRTQIEADWSKYHELRPQLAQFISFGPAQQALLARYSQRYYLMQQYMAQQHMLQSRQMSPPGFQQGYQVSVPSSYIPTTPSGTPSHPGYLGPQPTAYLNQFPQQPAPTAA